jgi:hypothetical protein
MDLYKVFSNPNRTLTRSLSPVNWNDLLLLAEEAEKRIFPAKRGEVTLH